MRKVCNLVLDIFFLKVCSLGHFKISGGGMAPCFPLVELLQHRNVGDTFCHKANSCFLIVPPILTWISRTHFQT